MSAKKTVGILGASGYTGAELVRLLLRHPKMEIAVMTADRRAGQAMGDVFPQFAPYDLPRLVVDRCDRLGQGRSGPDLLRTAACDDAEGPDGA